MGSNPGPQAPDLRGQVLKIIEGFPGPALVRLGLAAAVRGMSEAQFAEVMAQITPLFNLSVKEIQEGRGERLVETFRAAGAPAFIVDGLAEALRGRNSDKGK